MKKLTITLLAAAFVVMMAAGAMAALTDGNHNVVAHDGLSGALAQQGACSFCHVPHGAAGAGLFPSGLGAVTGGGSAWEADPVAVLCWDCHGSATYGGAQQIVPFQRVVDGAHGRDADQLITTTGWGDITGGDPDAALGGGNIFGYNTTTNQIGCQSCHNPHDNATRPFMRDNAIKETVVEGDLLTLCNDCHINRADVNTQDQGSAPTRQNHPADSANTLLADVAGNSNLYEYGGGLGVFSNRFNSTYPSLAVQITSITAGNDTDHWNAGGKFVAGSSGAINCGTCHMVHSNELDEASYAVGDGLGSVSVAAVPAGWAYNSLLVLDNTPAVGSIAGICAGCHDITTEPAAGPGALASYSHPYQSQEPWGISIDSGVVATYGAKFPGAFGTDATLVCQSCHDMHFARLSEQAVPADEYALQRVYCEDCHDASSTKPDHHPSGIDVTYGTELRDDGANTPPLIGTGITWDAVTRDDTQLGATSNWAASGTAYRFGPSAADGVMSCSTCHYSTAHNNVNPFPGVVGEIAEATMCIDCHGLNPSQYVDAARQTDRDGDTYNETGTHFLGTVTNTAWQWGNNTTKDSVTPVAGAAPVAYGQDGGTDAELICTSCHLLLTDTYPVQTADNGVGDTDNEATTLDAVGLLLTPSGNLTTDGAAANDSLCSACHGSAPGIGTTHPVQPTYTTDVSAEIWGNASALDNGVTVVGDNTGGGATGKGINCESCHRAHNAAMAWNTTYTTNHYILEQAARVDLSTYINEQVLCNACHTK